MMEAAALPPDLQIWRERLFHISEPVTLTEEEWNTYWPFVDNIWSHRSSQKLPNRPFHTHYYDCRMKGRAPGTPQNNDPTKKKRKRTARGRDLCDMKIKVQELFIGEPGVGIVRKMYTVEKVKRDGVFATKVAERAGQDDLPLAEAGGDAGTFDGGDVEDEAEQDAHDEARKQAIEQYGLPGMLGEVHRHTLEQSDRIKKNSVAREVIKRQKELKRIQKTYHKKASGLALETVKRHSKACDLKLFGSCFCPFVQRVWIALEVKGLGYQYIEVDPYKKPQNLLDINPRGLVPALKHGDWGCYESNVLLEYLEDLGVGYSLFPQHAQLKAHSRLWIDHINRHIVPGFYRYLQAQEQDKQIEFAEELKTEVSKIVDAANVDGPFFLGSSISLVDVSIAPWLLRFSRVLHPYRGWPLADGQSRLGRWIEALESSDAVKNTVSEDALYLDSYERYAVGHPARPDDGQKIDRIQVRSLMR